MIDKPWANQFRQNQMKQNNTWGNFTGGSDAYQFALDRLKNGIDPKQRAMIEGQSGGQIAGGKQGINESFAGSS